LNFSKVVLWLFAQEGWLREPTKEQDGLGDFVLNEEDERVVGTE